MRLDNLCYLGHSNCCSHLYCYIHKVSVDVQKVPELDKKVPEFQKESSRVRQEASEEGRRAHRLKHHEYNNKDEDNSLNNLNIYYVEFLDCCPHLY